MEGAFGLQGKRKLHRSHCSCRMMMYNEIILVHRAVDAQSSSKSSYLPVAVLSRESNWWRASWWLGKEEEENECHYTKL